MAAVRDSASPSLVVVLALLRICASFDPPSSTAAGPRPRRSASGPLDLLSDDYYEILDDLTTAGLPKPVSSSASSPHPCRHDVCSELQPPCAQLAASTGCLCPGITLDDVVPHPPAIKKVSREGSHVVVTWCAPYSRVNSYKVTVEGQGERVFGEGRRSCTVEGIDGAADICVFAVNDAGVSEGSCTKYQFRDTDVSLRGGLIGGALGLLSLLLLAVLLWKYAAKRTSAARISTRDAAESQQADSERGVGLGDI